MTGQAAGGQATFTDWDLMKGEMQACDTQIPVFS